MASKLKGKNARSATRPGATIWLTRAQAADRLGLTVSGVRGRVGLGLLKEYRDDRGTARYDAAEVDKMAKKLPVGRPKSEVQPGRGDLTATAFQMFARTGVDVRRAVVELRVPTEVAERLAEEYGRSGGEVVLKAVTVKDVRRLLGDRQPDLPMNDTLLPQLVTDYAQRIARDREDAGRRYDERLKAERDLAAKQILELEEALKMVTDERDAVFATLAVLTEKVNAAADNRAAPTPPTSPAQPVAAARAGEAPIQPKGPRPTAAGAAMFGDVPEQGTASPFPGEGSPPTAAGSAEGEGGT
jgi:hypothetical protein